MSENNSATTTRPPPPWERSAQFRSFASNHFQYRVGRGDISLLFNALTSELHEEGRPTVRQEAEVYISWTQLKEVTETLLKVVQAIESEVGVIPTVALTPEANAAHKEQVRAHVANLGMGPPRS